MNFPCTSACRPLIQPLVRGWGAAARVDRNGVAPSAILNQLRWLRRHSTVRADAGSTTIDPGEVRKFAALSNQWWRDDVGPFVGLHRMNEVRVPLIRRAVLGPPGRQTDRCGTGAQLGHCGPGNTPSGPLAGVNILDIGCGGGILSVALARLGARVVGIDASLENVKAAERHVSLDPFPSGRLTFECTSAEDLAARGATFDCVVASEVLEHVREPGAFVDACVQLMKPTGKLVFTTINRSPAAFALAILGAEYVLRLVPPGTHEWAKFVTPEELRSELQKRGLRVVAEPGLRYDPVCGRWGITRSTQVNYAMVAEREGHAPDGDDV